MSVFARLNEGFHHFRPYEVATKLIQLSKPEIEAGEVVVRSLVRVPAEVAEVLHQHKRAVELTLRIGLILDQGHVSRLGASCPLGRRVARYIPQTRDS